MSEKEAGEEGLLKYYTERLEQASGEKAAIERVFENLAEEAARLSRESQMLWRLYAVLSRTKGI